VYFYYPAVFYLAGEVNSDGKRKKKQNNRDFSAEEKSRQKMNDKKN
jgi:hypothetical protein